MTDYLGPYLLGPNDENQGIYTGDARELAKAIPDESVDLIFTDPVYQNIDDYRWLAETAARVLKEGSSLLGQCDHIRRYEVETTMRQSELTPCDLLLEIYPFAFAPIHLYRVWAGYKPYVWFARGKREGPWMQNRLRGNGRAKSDHQWGDSNGFTIGVIAILTNKRNVIFDPFTGSGTVPAVCKMLGRRWLAFEIDPDTAERARERVRMTQPPLFVPEPEQMEIEL